MAYLRELELYGFKTFADKTRLKFDHGITAIVGPNGSGKSNIVDAVRWVLGEQSARELRGTRMEDVIFAGSSSRRPLGIAEVSLTLDNPGLELGLDYGEIRLTRRVNRDGTSDYLVNRSPWRLKDLRDLLFGTGLGRNSYALIGQGEIEEVLLSRPEDRRLLFEEAASITRYRARQREALGQLDDIRERRSRLELIVEELERRLGPLREESDRAQKHAVLSERLADGEARLNVSTYVQAHKRLEEQRAVIDGLADRLEQLNQRRSAVSSELAETRREFEQAGSRVEETRRRVSALEERRERQRSQLELTRERAHRHEHDQQRLREQVRVLEDRLEKWEAEQIERTREVSAYEREVAATREVLVTDRDEIGSLEKRRDELSRCSESKRERLQRLREAASTTARRLDERREALERLRATQTALVEKRDEARRELEAASTRLQEVRDTLGKARARARELTQKREGLVGVVQKLRAARSATASTVSELTSSRDRLSSRLATLKEVEAGYEGYYQGVRAVLRARRQGDLEASGLLGAVSELITVRPELDDAIEVALGGGLQNIVATSAEAAHRAIDYLKQGRRGRATFLPIPELDVRDRISLAAPVQNDPDVLGWAADLVQCRDDCRPAIEYLLGRTLVVRDLKTAQRIRSQDRLRVRMVSLEGELLQPGGSVTGGKGASGRAGTGLLARRRDLAQLQSRVSELARDVEAQRQNLTETEGQLASAMEALEELAGEYARAQQQVEDGELALNQLDMRKTELEQSIGQLDRERRELQEKADRLSTELGDGEKRYQAQLDELQTAEAELAQVEDGFAQAERKLAELRAGLSARRSQLEDRTSQLGRLQKWLETEAERRRELEQQVAEARTQYLGARDGYQEESRRAAELETGLGRLGNELGEAREAHQQQQVRRRELAASIVELEGQLEQLNSTRENVVSTLHHGEVQLARWQVELETAEARLQDSAQCDGENGTRQVSAQLEAVEVIEDEKTLEKLSHKVKSLRRQLARLEPVNPGAVEEYRQVHERYERLYGYWNELEQGEAALYRLSRRLDELMRSTFLDAFEQVKREFSTVFQELFGGGEADIVLTGEGELWERGVDIVARPPGKKLQQISLLSGGERALTAIALVFAFLRCNPTPFVIMDEIDAALDDANLDKFARFLRDIASDNQFIIVTHQKRTMEEAGVLYGVTLGDDGTSRTVSVKLAAAEELVS